MPIKGMLFDKFDPNYIAKISKLVANICYLNLTIFAFFYTFSYSIYFILTLLFLGLNVESIAGLVLGEWIKENSKSIEETTLIFSLSFTLLTIINSLTLLIIGFLTDIYGLIVIQIYLIIYTIFQYIRFSIISNLKLNKKSINITKIYFKNILIDTKFILLTFSTATFYFMFSGMSVIIVNNIGKLGKFFEIYSIYSSISNLIAAFGGYLASIIILKRISKLLIFPIIYSVISIFLLIFPSIITIIIFAIISSLLLSIFSLNYYSLLNTIVKKEQYGIQIGFNNAINGIVELIAPSLFSIIIVFYSLFYIQTILLLIIILCLIIIKVIKV